MQKRRLLKPYEIFLLVIVILLLLYMILPQLGIEFTTRSETNTILDNPHQ